jgi:hypothetical protein
MDINQVILIYQDWNLLLNTYIVYLVMFEWESEELFNAKLAIFSYNMARTSYISMRWW